MKNNKPKNFEKLVSRATYTGPERPSKFQGLRSKRTERRFLGQKQSTSSGGRNAKIVSRQTIGRSHIILLLFSSLYVFQLFYGRKRQKTVFVRLEFFPLSSVFFSFDLVGCQLVRVRRQKKSIACIYLIVSLRAWAARALNLKFSGLTSIPSFY